MLNLEIPENDFTKTLEPKDRKGVLHALLEDCLKAAAQDEPLLIIIEDLHWIDALSHDLLEELARALTDSRICFVLAYRPPQLGAPGDAAARSAGELYQDRIERTQPRRMRASHPRQAGAVVSIAQRRGAALAGGKVDGARAGQSVLFGRTAQLFARPRTRSARPAMT